jgi:hypothetical protein
MGRRRRYYLKPRKSEKEREGLSLYLSPRLVGGGQGSKIKRKMKEKEGGPLLVDEI